MLKPPTTKVILHGAEDSLRRFPGRRQHSRYEPPSPQPCGICGTGPDQEHPPDRHHSRPAARRAPRPSPPLRTSGPGQDDSRQHHGHRDGRSDKDDFRTRHRATGGYGGDSNSASPGRHPLRRRDSQAQPCGRGGALPRSGRLLRLVGDRQGPQGPEHESQHQTVHVNWRDHPVRHAQRAPAQPVRLRSSPGIL